MYPCLEAYRMGQMAPSALAAVRSIAEMVGRRRIVLAEEDVCLSAGVRRWYLRRRPSQPPGTGSPVDKRSFRQLVRRARHQLNHQKR